MGISAGRMHGYVKIESLTKTPDDMGGFTTAWTQIWEGPCRYDRKPSFRGDIERTEGGATGSHPVLTIVVRYDEVTRTLLRSGSTMRALDPDEDLVMAITFAQDRTGRRETIEITASENLPT